MGRNNRRTAIITESSGMYEDFLEQRDLKRVKHYTTPLLNHPTPAQRRRMRTTKHVWKTGDTLMKLAYEHYKDVKLWWVIAWYNMKPTDAHYKLGQTVYIPQSIGDILSMLRSY